MNLGLVTYNLAKDWNLDKLIEMCAQHGFEGVELRTTHAHKVEADLTAAQRAERGSYVGCIAGTISFAEWEAGLREAGLADISITTTHLVADGMHGAIIKASKPVAASTEA